MLRVEERLAHVAVRPARGASRDLGGTRWATHTLRFVRQGERWCLSSASVG